MRRNVKGDDKDIHVEHSEHSQKIAIPDVHAGQICIAYGAEHGQCFDRRGKIPLKFPAPETDYRRRHYWHQMLLAACL